MPTIDERIEALTHNAELLLAEDKKTKRELRLLIREQRLFSREVRQFVRVVRSVMADHDMRIEDLEDPKDEEDSEDELE